MVMQDLSDRFRSYGRTLERPIKDDPELGPLQLLPLATSGSPKRILPRHRQ